MFTNAKNSHIKKRQCSLNLKLLYLACFKFSLIHISYFISNQGKPLQDICLKQPLRESHFKTTNRMNRNVQRPRLCNYPGTCKTMWV